ncbi:polycomb group protein EMF2B-like [Magnolia sinica]|uniref:polycomb group protein EMF2B-like n=1 Tax=Magnolia sinica TaxID=86752 RepID=UPI00265AB6BA|nr:polycomb group protein EMF2B-like [Magnolia sinica]XP_058088268.1 polycomb group protein EMF2B-like [Magnolia sinica]XP_058088269.1 polycomb group protein EMF2B-like [Magnolia sinica]
MILSHRIQMTISLGTGSDEVQVQNAVPLYVLLAKPVSDITVSEHSAVYQLRRTCILKAFSEFGSGDKKEATFVIPELRKLSADGKAGNLTVLLFLQGKLQLLPVKVIYSKTNSIWHLFHVQLHSIRSLVVQLI